MFPNPKRIKWLFTLVAIIGLFAMTTTLASAGGGESLPNGPFNWPMESIEYYDTGTGGLPFPVWTDMNGTYAGEHYGFVNDAGKYHDELDAVLAINGPAWGLVDGSWQVVGTCSGDETYHSVLNSSKTRLIYNYSSTYERNCSVNGATYVITSSRYKDNINMVTRTVTNKYSKSALPAELQ